ncbi:MAG: ADP-ribosylglycohydrolase family protein [Lentisphaeria bacterium]|nr:ADP-ribosylglycohydrolase family protein [Lentisphaeria bacterium]
MDIKLKKRFEGCLLGLACGDAFCAEFEGGIIERFLWKIIGKTVGGKKRYTDDTQMSLDLANYFVNSDSFSQQDIAQEFARGYRWSRGYGISTSKILSGVKRGKSWQSLNCKKFKDGSFGNGAAMRSPVIGLFCLNHEQKLIEYSEKVSQITHAHSLAIDSSVLISSIVYYLLHGDQIITAVEKSTKKLKTEEFKSKMDELCLIYSKGEILSVKQIVQTFGNSVSAIKSVPTAIYVALINEENSFPDLLNQCRKIGGDTDTIAAMAGAIWGTKNTSLKIDESIVNQVENHEMIVGLSNDLDAKVSGKVKQGV